MKLRSIRTATAAIALLGTIPLLWMLKEIGGECRSALVFYVPVLLGPSAIVALLGCLAKETKRLPIIMFVLASMSTAMWIYIAWAILAYPTDGQTGMAFCMIAIVQWFMVLLAITAFALQFTKHLT